MNVPSVTENERRQLTSDFVHIYSECVSESFAVIPSDAVWWKVNDISGMRALNPKDVQHDMGKILKIENSIDFVERTDAYPLRADCTEPNNIADWELFGYEVLSHWAVIAREYAGVSLSAEAYLDSSWALLQTQHGATRISGWNPEVVDLL